MNTPREIIETFYTVVELSRYADDHGSAILENNIPDVIQALYNNDTDKAKNILSQCENDIACYAIEINDDDGFHHLVENGAQVNDIMVQNFETAMSRLAVVFEKKNTLEGKKNIQETHGIGYNIIPLTSALNDNNSRFFNNVLGHSYDLVDKLIRREQRGIIE